MKQEPQQAFPYAAPNSSIRTKYADLFSLASLNERRVKFFFDKSVALIAIAIASPILCAILASHLFLCLFFPDQRGTLFIKYNAVSKGWIFSKYKFRVVKAQFVDNEQAALGDWHAYAAEWNPECHTHLGAVLKRLYLDELPQLFNILFGHMSVVGPRPLAVHHYERDIAQGNIYRKLVKAGLFGPSQALKGTDAFGDPSSEFEYAERHVKSSGATLVWNDLILIGCGVRVVLHARGL